MRAYCDFYEVDPPDQALLEVSRALIADPEREGVQLIARSTEGTALGFATVYWSWDTLAASRVGIMHDLFVAPDARGTGLADDLIRACIAECAQHGDEARLADGARQRACAAGVRTCRATRDEWLDYWLPVTSASS